MLSAWVSLYPSRLNGLLSSPTPKKSKHQESHLDGGVRPLIQLQQQLGALKPGGRRPVGWRRLRRRLQLVAWMR